MRRDCDGFVEVLVLTPDERVTMVEMIRTALAELRTMDARNAEFIENSDDKQTVRLRPADAAIFDEFEHQLRQLLGDARTTVATSNLFASHSVLGEFKRQREVSLMNEAGTWHLSVSTFHADRAFQGSDKTPLTDSFQLRAAREAYGSILNFERVKHE